MNEEADSTSFLWRRLPKGKDKSKACAVDQVEIQLLQTLDLEGNISKEDRVEMFLELMMQTNKVETKVSECVWTFRILPSIWPSLVDVIDGIMTNYRVPLIRLPVFVPLVCYDNGRCYYSTFWSII